MTKYLKNILRLAKDKQIKNKEEMKYSVLERTIKTTQLYILDLLSFTTIILNIVHVYKNEYGYYLSY